MNEASPSSDAVAAPCRSPLRRPGLTTVSPSQFPISTSSPSAIGIGSPVHNLTAPILTEIG